MIQRLVVRAVCSRRVLMASSRVLQRGGVLTKAHGSPPFSFIQLAFRHSMQMASNIQLGFRPSMSEACYPAPRRTPRDIAGIEWPNDSATILTAFSGQSADVVSVSLGG